jgi:hypothetical protein
MYKLQFLPELELLQPPVSTPVPAIPSIKAGRQSLKDHYYSRPYMLEWDRIKEAIPQIEFLVAWQGDFARVTSDIEQLAGTGHKVTLLSPNERDIKLAQLDLNAFARKIRKELGGLPGLINDLFMQLITSGAISQEWEIAYDDPRKRRGQVVAIHRVDVPTLVLQYNQKEHGYVPYQQTNTGTLTPLKYPKYQLLAMRALSKEPYPIPPFLSALEEMGRLNNALASVDRAIKKLGLLGLLALQVKKPVKMFFESELAYQTRLENYLAIVHETLRKGFQEGIVTHYESIESPKILNFAGEINNSLGFMKLLQNRLVKSLGEWMTEDTARASSWISVVYEKMLAKLQHTQGLVASMLEIGILLHLLLKGRKIYDVQLSFSQDSARFWEKKNVEADYYVKLVEKLAYDPQKALQHMGYGEEEEARTFPIHVQDILARNYYGVHSKHCENLYCGIFSFNHYQNPDSNPRLYKTVALHTVNLADL